MARRLRITPGGLVCHILNRANARAEIFHDSADYASSLWRRQHAQAAGLLSAWPVVEPTDWLALVNQPQFPAEENSLRHCIAKGRPYGSADFQTWTGELLGLQSAFRSPGQPAKDAKSMTPDPFGDSLTPSAILRRLTPSAIPMSCQQAPTTSSQEATCCANVVKSSNGAELWAILVPLDS